MGAVQFTLGLRRPATLYEDWFAWLPADKDQVFGAAVEGLETAYAILSVALDSAFTLCQTDKVNLAREQAVMFSGLFDEVASRLRALLAALCDQGRDLAELPNVAPLQPEFFRSERAQQVARNNFLLSLMVFRTRARFFRKVAALEAGVEHLRAAAHDVVTAIAGCPPAALSRYWTELEVLDYDLNTCLQETTIVLKSFLRVLPDEQLVQFRNGLYLRQNAPQARL